MNVDELSRSEQVALVGLARHLVDIDGELSDSELFDMLRLGVAIGKETFAAALQETESYYREVELLLAKARVVERPEARTRILAELDRIARGDGLHDEEEAFLVRLGAAWS